jgi:hypothetical protein
MSEQTPFVRNVRTKVEELSRKVKEAQGRAATYVETTSRGQAVVVAESLRKVASRLEQFGKAASASSSPAVH